MRLGELRDALKAQAEQIERLTRRVVALEAAAGQDKEAAYWRQVKEAAQTTANGP